MKPRLWTSTHTSGTIAHMVLGAAGLDAEVRFISLRQGEHKTPDYLRLNPKGEVPALEVAEGVVVTELPAIIAWIAEAAPDSGLLPRDPNGRAKALEWLAWCHFRTANTFSLAFQAKRFTDGDEAAALVLRRVAERRAREALDFAEAQLAARGGTLLGTEGPTAPDIFLAALADFAGYLQVDISDLARLGALRQRVQALPGVAAAMRREQEHG
jgi:glutathione S-transferase